MDNFKIYDKVNSMIPYVHNNVIVNVPKSHKVIRDKVLEYVFDISINIIKANENAGALRNKYQKEVLVYIMALDQALSILKELGYIENKKFIVMVNKLNELKIMVKAWISSEKK